MARFVKFPGTAGSYASTDDVNIADGDTANLQQSVGKWRNINSTKEVELSALFTPQFGDFVLSFKVSTDSTNVGISTNIGNTDGIAVPSATELTVSMFVQKVVDNDRTFRMRIRQFDAAGVAGSVDDYSEAFPAAAGSFGQVANTFTTDADAAWMRVEYRIVGSSLVDDQYLLDAVCVRLDAVATFVPSLRIVGDSDLRAKFAATDYTTGLSQYVIGNYASNQGYSMYIDSTGILSSHNGDGTGARLEKASNAPAFVDGTAYVVRYTASVSTGDISWEFDAVQVDTDTMTIAPSVASGASVFVGTSSASNWLAGDVYWVEVRDGIDGPIVAVFAADDVPGAPPI